jgi:hypothetical protein
VIAVWTGHLTLFYVNLVNALRKREGNGGVTKIPHFEQDMVKSLE